MQGANQMFRSDPKGFLKANTIMCYSGETQQKNDINRVNKNTLLVTPEFQPTVEFDLQRQPKGFYSLVMVGGTGSFGRSSFTRFLGYGQPIVGNYIPYLGQKKNPNSKYFGKINLSHVTSNYVFTFTFTGCNFVVTKVAGKYWVYHEPTAEAWKGNRSAWYNGEQVVTTLGPRYDDDHLSGFGCLVRRGPASWTMYAQATPFGQFRPDWVDEAIIDISS